MTITERPEKYAGTEKVNGIELYYEFYPREQAEKTLFCIHGFLASSFSFRTIIPDLADEYAICAVDYPPHGKTEKSRNFTYSYKNIAKTLTGLIRKLELENVVIVGHSMGGQIGLHMLLEEQNLFEKAVLLASSAYLKKARKSLVYLSYLPFSHRLIKRKLIQSGGVEGNLKQVVYDHSIVTDEMINGYLEPFIQNDDIFYTLSKFVRDREDDLSPGELAKIYIPILLVWGEFDKIVPLKVGKRLEEDLPNAKLTVFEKTGHLIPEEKPEETVRLIKKFLKNS